jgi:hypothetical protein
MVMMAQPRLLVALSAGIVPRFTMGALVAYGAYFVSPGGTKITVKESKWCRSCYRKRWKGGISIFN